MKTIEERSNPYFANTHAKDVTGGSSKGEKRIPGELGIWFFIFGDMLMFAALFGVFLHDRSSNLLIFNLSQENLHGFYGFVNTLILLSSSICVVLAIRAMRHEMRANASFLILMAIGCGLSFACIKCFEYSEKISSGILLTTNLFWTYYYVITGVHLFHLLIGLGVLSFCYMQARQGRLSVERLRLVEGGACFWHMVDLLWIVIFPLLYLVR
ncbi:cytochrome c oxidase subunit 3 family protein [Sinimarinibacterium sp. CAU 1509]|uniref:cytochrome c oxidase subunit 3 family protein n=1 Tax=Sinimarinibacterium sp. CAU 1509 TaxID=2562283 RepID=UPI0010ABEE86|nr:cytochrome c oxidase subunit 3 family protein [Sinimarinibacterium sp. CAU 1509]TJY58397.1 cytochrome c oxidase subunit 3 family protein [Sinimarinibacterium sp. CAU 1509]